MYVLTVETEKGEKLNFQTNPYYDILKIDGLQPPATALNFSEIAGFDGSQYNSGRSQNRNIVLTIKIYPDVEANRIALYHYFQTKKSIKIYYENGVRNVFIDGIVETFECDLFVQNEQAVVSIVCPSPYWKDVKTAELTFSNTSDLFEFPFAIDSAGVEFSTLSGSTTANIYNSDVEKGCVIEFIANTNYILNPRFLNLTTGEYIGANVDMEKGDVIRINTIRGEKSIVLIKDGEEKNILYTMQNGAKWVQLAAGENILSYEADEGAENLSVLVRSTNYYEGV